jgi:hypothetical protein
MGRAGWLAVQISSAHHPMAHPGSGVLGIAVLGVGLALMGYGLVPVLRRWHWRTEASRTQGQVIDHEPRPAGRGEWAWRPVIQFEANGTTVRFRTPETCSRSSWPVGHLVDVLYDRADPQRAGLAQSTWVLSWPLIIGIGVVGAFAAVINS